MSKQKLYRNVNTAQSFLLLSSFLMFGAIGFGGVKIILNFGAELGVFALPLLLLIVIGFIYCLAWIAKLSGSIDTIVKENMDNDLLQMVKESQEKFPSN